jgi:hypothetical protein
MVSSARRRRIDRARKAIYHCTARCVRRAFLCGEDRATGRDYSHRRDWIVVREEQLSGLFAIEVEFRSELSNHLHVVLRTRPEVVERWSDYEVARRWLTITRLAKWMEDTLPEPHPQAVEKLAKDRKKLAKVRRRLADISWFMGILCENIARRVNAEEGCPGKFWDARFRCRECTDANAVLLVGIYVDLNPWRAGEAYSLETARYTSLYQRLQAQAQSGDAGGGVAGWMAALTLEPERKVDEQWAYRSRSGRRVSDLGVLPISLADYVRLLQWTWEMLRSGQRTTIPQDLGAVLERLSIEQEAWLDTVDQYESVFCHVVGSTSSMAAAAARMGVGHLKGTAAARAIFG